MYFPYLRGKQFELIALREFAAKHQDNHKILPIIEPVKSTFNNLITATDKMFDCNLQFALVLNPQDGDFKRENKDLLLEIPNLNRHREKWIPAFLFKGNADRILETIVDNELNNVMVIFKNGIDDNDLIFSFLGASRIKYIVNGDANSRSIMRRLSTLSDKHIIRLDNCFKEKTRNADYIETVDEKFTEEHSYYVEDHFCGFSDYTVLPKDFVDGGMLPYAVAIHMTYKKNDREIYVHHFVSDTNDDNSNIKRKFVEAAKKLKDFFKDMDKTDSIDEMIQFVNEEKYPGLGIIKKLSIRNHIELINSIILPK